MALHTTPAEHQADPPSSWTVKPLAGHRWQLVSSGGATLETFTTKRDALAAKSGGWWVSLYEREGRWFAGLPVPGWKLYEGEQPTCTELACTECGAPASQSCEVYCIADQALPAV